MPADAQIKRAENLISQGVDSYDDCLTLSMIFHDVAQQEDGADLVLKLWHEVQKAGPRALALVHPFVSHLIVVCASGMGPVLTWEQASQSVPSSEEFEELKKRFDD